MSGGPGTATERRRAANALVVLVAALTLGIVVGTQLRTQVQRPALGSRYQVLLVEAVAELRREQADLRAQLVSLRGKLDEIQREGARLDSAALAMQPEIDGLRREAGLSEERGPGVVVTLDDARRAPATGGIESAIVHALDLTDVFNAAWAAGARAISVNGERIVGTSSCVGATIQINGVLMSPPFEIAVLGAPEPLFAELTTGLGLADLRRRHDRFGLGFQVTRSTNLVAPAFSGPIRVRYAAARS